MTTTLRVIAEDAVVRPAAGLGRYAFELTRALIATTPPDCAVELIFAAHPPRELEQFRELFPGAADVHAVSLGRDALRNAWRHGMATAAGRGGIVHAPSLLAPLTRHDRGRTGTQQVASIHDTLAWTHPSALARGEAAWLRHMARRAERHADAIVVPTHAVAAELGELLDVGDRLRVIGGAVSSSLVLPDDADARAAWLRLPPRYLLAHGSIEHSRGIDALIDALKLPELDGLPLLVVGEDESRAGRISAYAMEAGLPEGRVRALGTLSDSDLALALSRAAAFVAPGRAEGFGLAALEALTLGTPLIHSDAPALLEVAADAGYVVARVDAESYPQRLAAAIAKVLGDTELAERMRVLGLDRAKAFSWRDSGARVWQLHADL